MKKKIFLLIQFFSLLFLSVSAQFVNPLEMSLGDAIVTTSSGERFEGRIKSTVGDQSGVVSLKFVTDHGDKQKLYASEIQEIKQKPGRWNKLEIFIDKSSDKKKQAHSNYEEVVKLDYIIWEQVELPNGKSFVMLQLLNPGFDSKIKVFYKPSADKGELSIGGVSIADSKVNEYYVVKDGKTYKMNKKLYKKGGYEELFGDCDYMTQLMPDYDDFAKEVFTYDQACK